MSDYLAYWKEYWKDTEETRQMFTEEWHTKSKRFYRQVKPDDNLWIVVTGGRDNPNEWRLLQRLHIRQVQLDSTHERPYHLLGTASVDEELLAKIRAMARETLDADRGNADGAGG